MKIPRIFHQLWIGDKAFPKKFKRYQKTWKRNHPDWELCFWRERNLPHDLLNLDCLPLCNNPSEVSDVLRYSLLYKYGGVWIDTDFENYKNIEPLIKDLDIFASSEDNYHICGGFFGATPQHPLVKRLIDKIPSTLRGTMDKPSDHRIGPRFVTNNISWDEITILPREYFYPYLPSYYHSLQILERGDARKNGAYAVHHWNCSWIRDKRRGIL